MDNAMQGQGGGMRYLRPWVMVVLMVSGLVMGQLGSVLAQGEDAPTVTVGSLSFTESVILSEMLALMLEDAGYEVERAFELGVSADLHEALTSGEIDVYVEYTGGGLVAILGSPVPTDNDDAATPSASIAERTYAIVSEQYRDAYGLIWLDEIGFNDSYALAVTQETAEELGIETISDLVEHAGDMTLATDAEFPDRHDGLPQLEEVYGIEFAEVRPGDPAAMYDAIASGEVDVITAYTTDGRLPGLDLVLLEDDGHAFPPYYAAPVVDQDLLEENPELEGILNQLAGRIDEETMARLNAQVDVDGMTPADVARAFLEEEGIISSSE